MGSYDYAMLYRIAKSYYKDDLSQQAISKRENISRPHVSRMLAKARECGIVKIDVKIPVEPEIEKLEQKLRDKLGLKAVKLAYVQEPAAGKELDPSMDIATIAAVSIPSFISHARTVGVGWGHTVYQTSLLLDHIDADGDMSFVPLIGLSGENNPYLQINVIVDRFAEKYSAESYYTIMPVIRSKQQRMDPMEKESYSRLSRQWEKLDAAIVGLGPTPKAGTVLVAEGSKEYHRQIAQSGTVGDILANFFYEDGRVFDTTAYYQQISLPLDMLKKIDTVICIAGGSNKVEGILAAAQNGFYNVLISDNQTAQKILDRI